MATAIPENRAPLTAWAAAAATGGRILHVSDHGGPAAGITSDSRAIVPGAAFVALRGDKYDGHDYVKSAIDGGASLVVVERGRFAAAVDASSPSVVEVDDTLIAWADLARAHLRSWRRQRKEAVIVAITGSAGKTTTKELCAALLRPVGECHTTPGNLNNRIGVPAVAFGLELRHRFAVFEVGMSVRGEIAALGAILEPDVAILTNVGVAHAAGVGGSRADVAREKGDLFAGLSERAIAVVRGEDEAAVGQLARTRAARSLTFGTRAGVDYRLLEPTSSDFGGANVRIERGGTTLDVRMPIVGQAAALDLAAALAATEAITGPRESAAITRALSEQLSPLPGRMQARHLANGTVVLDDSYNANPESVRAALETLADVAKGRRAVVILGEMRELGGVSAFEHTSLGRAIAQSGARVAISCGGFAELSVAAAEHDGVFGVRAPDTEAAARSATSLAIAGDVILVKGSRSVGVESVVHALVEAGGGEIAPPKDTR